MLFIMFMNTIANYWSLSRDKITEKNYFFTELQYCVTHMCVDNTASNTSLWA